MSGYRVRGGGGGASPLVYNEPVHVRDAAATGVREPEPLRVVDAPRVGVTRGEALHAVDAYTLTAVPSYGDAAHARDAFSSGVLLNDTPHVRDGLLWGWARNEPIVARDASVMGVSKDDHLRLVDASSTGLSLWTVTASGTPDTDKFGDGWVDQAATTTPHGTTTSMVAKGASTAPGSDERISFWEADMTGITGATAGTGSVHGIRILASTSNGVSATTLTVEFAVQAGRWFTESTLTWANKPLPTYTAMPSISVATGATAAYTSFMTQANFNTCIGNWVLFRFRTAGGAAPDTVTITTREAPTSANRPRLAATLNVP